MTGPDPLPDPGGESRRPSGSLLHPREPIATRLNRNALLVAAAVLGVTVLVAIVLLEPTTPPTPSTGAAQAPPPVPAQATFLDQPPRTAATDSDTHDSTAIRSGRPDSLGIAMREGGTTPRRPLGAAADANTWNSTAAAEKRSLRQSAFDAARAGGVRIGFAPASDTDAGLAPSFKPTAESATDSAPPLLAPTRDRAVEAGPSVVAPIANTTPLAQREPTSPYTLAAGSVIDGRLITGIVSDLPGTVVGEVARDVFDSRTQHLLLIPKESRLVGTYDNRIAPDQERLLVEWTQLILPNGRRVRLPRIALADRAGESGIHDGVETHTAATYGRALLLSLVGAGAELSQPQQASVFAPPSARQVAAGAVGQQLSDVALESVRRGLDRPPTITIRAGLPFAIVLPDDLVLDGSVDNDGP